MQCTAKAHSTGKQCTRRAIAGGRVCQVHGGAAPQVKASAAQRLAAMVDPALGVMLWSMKQSVDRKVKLRAAMDVLDRSVGKTPDTIRLIGSGENGAVQIEDVTIGELVRRDLARVRTRSGSGRDS